MSASISIGRVRGLAGALGIGAALLTGVATAAADPGAPDSAAAETATSTPAPARAAAGPVAARRSTAPRSRPARASRITPPRRNPQPARVIPSPAAGLADRPGALAAITPPATTGSRPLPASATAAAPAPAWMRPEAAAARPGASPLRALAATLRGAPGLPGADPATTASVGLLAVTALIQTAVVVGVAALTPAPPSPSSRVTSTLNLKGFDIVPSSTEVVTSIYGRWTYLPGAPGLVQGRQQFSVVDPTTSDTVGTFDALVSRGTGIDYQTLLVTANDGTNVGTDAGQVPPVGSLVSHFQLGKIGLSYTAMPSPSGDLVTFTITTPSRELTLDVPFDAAKGIADRTVDNRPIGLGNGYSIAPADPNGETLTGISGILPLFTTVQGHQTFNVYDSAGTAVGSFDGIFTTTSDIIGTYTQAVMVTANDGVNVGTGAGQTPPVGSVYNVIYRESDDHFFLYSSLPAPTGNQVSVIEVDHGTVTNSALTLIDASAPPAYQSLSAANGYRFVPVSELQPSGINGLPPRDVQVQGYQQFDVYDAAGTRIGAVDADVSTQWDAFGIHSKALLVTRVSEGTPGTGPAEIPPVGSVFNFLTSGDGGFTSAHAVVPLPIGDQTSFEIGTPNGDIALPTSNVPVVARTKVTFYTPFQTV